MSERKTQKQKMEERGYALVSCYVPYEHKEHFLALAKKYRMDKEYAEVLEALDGKPEPITSDNIELPKTGWLAS